MKIISTALKNAKKKDSIVERDYIILTGTTDRIYLWFKLYDDCYKDGNIVQNFIMKRLEFEYADNDINFFKKEFKAYKEYKLEDGTWEAIDYGSFIVTDISESDTKESVKVTAYDYALKFANEYKTDLDYGSITLLDVLQECCAKCGVELETTVFANHDFVVDSNQFESSAQFGNVVSAVAGASGSFAKIVNDKLEIRFTNETDVIIDLLDYEEFEDKRDSHPITVVGFGMTNIEGENVVLEWQEGVEQYGKNYLMINDNPFAYTQSKREQLVTAVFNKIKGFNYSAMVLKNCLYPELECGDLVKVRNRAGELVDTIILRTSFEGVICNLEAPSITKASVEYSNALSALSIAKRTEYIVNKHEQTITAIAEEQTEHTNKLAQQQISIDEIEQKVSNVQEFSRDIAGTYQLVTEEAGNVNLMHFELFGKTELKSYVGRFFAGAGYATGNSKITLVIDKNARGNISSEAIIKEYNVPQMLSKGDAADKLVVEVKENGKNIVKLLKYIKLVNNKYVTLVEPEITVLEDDIDLALFEGINYIYIKEHKNWKMSAKYLIKSDYNKYYATRVEMNSTIDQTANNIMLEVAEKVDEDKMTSAINLAKNEINLEVAKKVDEDEVIAAINLTSEEAKINANKITLEGKTIDLTADNVSIASDKFSVDKNGNMTCNNATMNNATANDLKIVGGNIKLKDSSDAPAIMIGELFNNGTRECSMTSKGFTAIDLVNNTQANLTIEQTRAFLWAYSDVFKNVLAVSLNSEDEVNNKLEFISGGNIKIKASNSETKIMNDQIIISTTDAKNWIVFTSSGIAASNDLSDKSLKKNIKNSSIKALEIIKQIKHREFNWKNKEKHVENGYIAQELEKLGDYTEKVIDPQRKRSIYS